MLKEVEGWAGSLKSLAKARSSGEQEEDEDEDVMKLPPRQGRKLGKVVLVAPGFPLVI